MKLDTLSSISDYEGNTFKVTLCIAQLSVNIVNGCTEKIQIEKNYLKWKIIFLIIYVGFILFLLVKRTLEHCFIK